MFCFQFHLPRQQTRQQQIAGPVERLDLENKCLLLRCGISEHLGKKFCDLAIGDCNFVISRTFQFARGIFAPLEVALACATKASLETHAATQA